MKKITVLVCLLSAAFIAKAEGKDSIDQKIVDGQRYVVYKVEAKETLYSLSKKYNTSVDAIKNANNGLITGLQNDATILIPVAALNTASQTASKPTTIKSVQALHVVGEGETLYSISKKYNVNVEDIKSWNGLTDNAISLGQELKVSYPNQKPVISEKVPVIEVSDKVKLLEDDAIVNVDTDVYVPVEKPVLKPVKVVEKKEYTIDTSMYGEEVTVTKPVVKIGTVGIDQSKNLAQFSNVKVGTILMIVNPLNNKASFVRVIEGESTNELKVTNAVLQSIGITNTDGKNVNISYTK